MSSKKSYAIRVERHCKKCNYDVLDKGTWRQQVESCTDSACDFHDVRPLTIKSEAKARANLIAVS